MPNRLTFYPSTFQEARHMQISISLNARPATRPTLCREVSLTSTPSLPPSLPPFPQEARYMQILVDKLLGLQPDLLCVGKSVSRHAQEHLTRRGVALMQHVKPEVGGGGRGEGGGRDGGRGGVVVQLTHYFLKLIGA